MGHDKDHVPHVTTCSRIPTLLTVMMRNTPVTFLMKFHTQEVISLIQMVGALKMPWKWSAI